MTIFIIVKQLQYDDKPRQVLLIYVDGKLFDKFIRDNVSDTVRFGLSFDGMPVYEWNSKDAETAGEQIFVKEVPSGMYRWNYEFTVDMSYINGSGPAAYSLILGCCGLFAACVRGFLSSCQADTQADQHPGRAVRNEEVPPCIWP